MDQIRWEREYDVNRSRKDSYNQRSYIFPNSPQSPPQMQFTSPYAPGYRAQEPQEMSYGVSNVQVMPDESSTDPPSFSLYNNLVSREGNLVQQQPQYQQSQYQQSQYQQAQYEQPQYQPLQYQQAQYQPSQYQPSQFQALQKQQVLQMPSENLELERWVTVFGFKPELQSLVRQLLSEQGEITKISQSVPVDANWLHVQFKTKQEAQRALLRNPTKLGESTIIGLIPCTDRNVLLEAPGDSGSGMFPGTTGVGEDLGVGVQPWQPGPKVQERRGYGVNVVQEGPKPAGIFTKLWDYVIGW